MTVSTVFPSGFLKRVRGELSPAEFTEFMQASSQSLRKSIRINMLKISVSDFKRRAQDKNWKLTPIPWCTEGFWIDRPLEEQRNVPLGKTIEHILGLFYIQEASSMLPPEALLQQENNLGVVLDMAAAPGSKTTQLAAKMGNKGLLIANEFSASRIKGLFSNLERCGVRNVALTHFDGMRFAALLPESFDAVLLDAPCTGEGIVRKDRKVLENWSERRIVLASSVQKKLILAAFQALRPGGSLVYSTCTLAREENEAVCHFLREKYPETAEFVSLIDLFPGAAKASTPEGFLRVWPHTFDTEGFFVAKIRKKSGAGRSPESVPHENDRLKKFPFSSISTSKFQLLKTYYQNHFGWPFDLDSRNLWQRKREVWFFPESSAQFFGRIRFDRIGIKLCEVHEKGIKTGHETAVQFGPNFSRNTLALPRSQVRDFLAGKDLEEIPPNSDLAGEVLCMYEEFPLGLGKIQGAKLKNLLPRAIVEAEAGL